LQILHEERTDAAEYLNLIELGKVVAMNLMFTSVHREVLCGLLIPGAERD